MSDRDIAVFVRALRGAETLCTYAIPHDVLRPSCPAAAPAFFARNCDISQHLGVNGPRAVQMGYCEPGLMRNCLTASQAVGSARDVGPSAPAQQANGYSQGHQGQSHAAGPHQAWQQSPAGTAPCAQPTPRWKRGSRDTAMAELAAIYNPPVASAAALGAPLALARQMLHDGLTPLSTSVQQRTDESRTQANPEDVWKRLMELTHTARVGAQLSGASSGTAALSTAAHGRTASSVQPPREGVFKLLLSKRQELPSLSEPVRRRPLPELTREPAALLELGSPRKRACPPTRVATNRRLSPIPLPTRVEPAAPICDVPVVCAPPSGTQGAANCAPGTVQSISVAHAAAASALGVASGVIGAPQWSRAISGARAEPASTHGAPKGPVPKWQDALPEARRQLRWTDARFDKAAAALAARCNKDADDGASPHPRAVSYQCTVSEPLCRAR